VNIFSAPGNGSVSPKLVGQNKNAPALSPHPPLIYDRSLMLNSDKAGNGSAGTGLVFKLMGFRRL